MDTQPSQTRGAQYALAVRTLRAALKRESSHMRFEVNYVLESALLDGYFQKRLDEERSQLNEINFRIRKAVWDPSTGGAWDSYWQGASSLVEECRILQEGAFIRYGNGDVYATMSEAVTEIVGTYERIAALVAAMSHEFARITGTNINILVSYVPRIEVIPPPAPMLYLRGVEQWDKTPVAQDART